MSSAYKKISFNAVAAKEMGKDTFIKTFKSIYSLSEKELSAEYDKIVPKETKTVKEPDKSTEQSGESIE